ncbi:early nodulin-75-like [Capsella rubella]|uniref:early nodulin-75-like n=1 Tax=Capsella rubella TaxID=81985 RepID=UPI000CD51234|nr:early nodulin-75-like [Capsella rubella]
MSVTLIHSYLVRDYFAVPFLTPQGIGYHHFCRNSFLHVPQRVVVPLLGLKKRSQKPYFKPSTTTTEKPQSNPSPVHEKPVHDEKPVHEKPVHDEKPVHQAEAPPPTHQEAPPPTQQEAPPTTQEAPPTTHQEPPPTHQEAPPPTRQEAEFFGGSVTMGAAPSPRHVPIPMFYLREKIKESSKLTKT